MGNSSVKFWLLSKFTYILLISVLLIPADDLYSLSGGGKNSVSVEPGRLAGFRASRVPSSYPNSIFPGHDYWVNVGSDMSDKFSPSSPSSLWIVSLYIDSGNTLLGFPGGTKDFIYFSGEDQNEEYLNRFDAEGFKIFLQVEPGAANIDTLIDLVLNRYKHHPCVAGFGIDGEWYYANLFPDGKEITDMEAQRWEARVKSHNPNYQFFIKHFKMEKMPPTYRGEIIFVYDGQQFANMTHMLNYCKSWGDRFAPNKVGYQYGYPSDQFWWSTLNDPAKTIGDALVSTIPNIYGLYWVDFSVNTLWPIGTTNAENVFNQIPDDYILEQNYPNPFNPATKIKFRIADFGFVSLKIYDVLGNEVADLINEEKVPGTYEINFNSLNNGRELPSGAYFYRLSATGRAGSFTDTKKMILIK